MTTITPEGDGNRKPDESRLEAIEKIANASGVTATHVLFEITTIPYDGTESATVVVKVESVGAVSDEWHSRPA